MLKFLTGPSVKRSGYDNVIISGCSYTSSAHSSLTSKSYVRRNNDDLIAISTAKQVADETKDGNVFTLPTVKLHDIEGGDFRCLVIVNNKFFWSDTTKYIPGKSIHYNC